MTTAPPPLLVAVVERLLPPDAREAVLGDLWERYRSPMHFAAQAGAVLPFLVFARVLRRSSWSILGLQAFLLFACLGGFALPRGDAAVPMWARAALPTLCAFLALVWHDAYRGTRTDGPPHAIWGEAVAVILGIGLSQMLTIALVAMAELPARWVLPLPALLTAVGALPAIYVLRAGSWLKVAGQPSARADLAEDYERFRTRVRRRNRLEVCAMLAVMLIAGLALVRYFLVSGGPVSAIIWLTQAQFAILCVYLATRGSAPALPPQASIAEVHQLFRSQLLRQHRLRRMLTWWWLAPLFFGLARDLLTVPWTEPLPARPIFGIVLMLTLAACIHALNEERANAVRRRVDELGALALP